MDLHFDIFDEKHAMNSVNKDHKSDTTRAWIIERIYIHATPVLKKTQYLPANRASKKTSALRAGGGTSPSRTHPLFPPRVQPPPLLNSWISACAYCMSDMNLQLIAYLARELVTLAYIEFIFCVVPVSTIGCTIVLNNSGRTINA